MVVEEGGAGFVIYRRRGGVWVADCGCCGEFDAGAGVLWCRHGDGGGREGEEGGEGEEEEGVGHAVGEGWEVSRWRDERRG